MILTWTWAVMYPGSIGVSKADLSIQFASTVVSDSVTVTHLLAITVLA